jgi:protease-4
MKHFPQIISKVYEQPWLITPAKHRAIQRLITAHMDGHGMDMPEKDDEEEDEEIAMDGGTAIIPVHGIIGKHLSMLETMCGGCDLDGVSQMLDVAGADKSVKRVLLDFRTPGGTVTGIPELARKIANYSKPTLAFTDSECCSAGYWLASQCGQFYATESSNVGSVGVYMALLDESRALENEGIKINAIKAGEFKLAGASFKPLSETERAMFQSGVDKLHAQFKDAVLRNREIDTSCLEGQCFDGDAAVANGMVDWLVESITEALDAQES